jgi:predicted nucleic acid-binding protein
MNWLVETDVLCERTKARPNPLVLDWLRDNADNIYTSRVVIWDFGIGIERLRSRRKAALKEWLLLLIKSMEERGRILDFNDGVASVWAQQELEYSELGCPMPTPDSFIAAEARLYKLTIVTRNVADYQRPGLRVFNPFTSSVSSGTG